MGANVIGYSGASPLRLFWWLPCRPRWRLSRTHVICLLSSTALLPAIACSELRETEPGRTAAEQLLFLTAIERVFDKLVIQIPSGSEVCVDPGYVRDTDSPYLVATPHDQVLRQGGKLVTTRDQADLLLFDVHDNDLMSAPHNDDWVGECSFEETVPDFDAGS